LGTREIAGVVMGLRALLFFFILKIGFGMQKSGATPLLKNSEIFQIAQFETSLEESSGLAFHDGFFWTVNDSGNSNVIFKISKSGTNIHEVEISNAENIDWESLAQDETYLYVADTGNNLNRRSNFTIYKIPWTSLVNSKAEAEVLTFAYGDYESGKMRSHNFDAEAIAINGNEVWLFSKNRGDQRTRLYKFPKLAGHYSPDPAQSLPVNSLVTGADINSANDTLFLLSVRRSSSGMENLFWEIPINSSGVDWDNRMMTRIAPEDQWEALVYDEYGDEFYFTHEDNRRGYAGLGRLERR
jgi:hypothetical protein